MLSSRFLTTVMRSVTTNGFPVSPVSHFLPATCACMFSSTKYRTTDSSVSNELNLGPETAGADDADTFGTLKVEKSHSKGKAKLPTASTAPRSLSESTKKFSKFSKLQTNGNLPPTGTPGNLRRPRHVAKRLASDFDDLSAEQLEHDVFGTLSNPDWRRIQQMEEMEEEDDDVVNLPVRQRPWYYLVKMRHLIRKQNLPAALHFFEVKMLKEDRARPLRTVYDMLIAACGRAGYTEKAFSLYRSMKEHKFLPVDPTYVGLFNACAESPYKDKAIELARKLREELQRKNITPNQIVYHSMIKAFGRCGDLLTAFEIADEMKSLSYVPDAQTYSFLLQAAISDRVSGLKHAVEVWRMMLKSGVRPDIYHYNLLLKAVRDCGVGPDGLFSELLPPSHDEMAIEGMSVVQQTLMETVDDKREKRAGEFRRKLALDQFLQPVEPEPRRKPHEKRRSLTFEMERAKKRWWELEAWTEETWQEVENPTKVDLLLPREAQSRSSIIGLNAVQTPEDRIQLLGGWREFLKRMARDRVKPDLKTFSQIIEVLPRDGKDDLELIEAAKNAGIKVDIDFYNLLIKRRCFLGDYDGAKDLLALAKAARLKPTEVTFGCLANGCKKLSQAKDLLENLKEAKVQPNPIIFSTLIGQACYRLDPWFLVDMMSKMREMEVAVNEIALKKIERFRENVRTALIAKDRREPYPETIDTDYFRNGWKRFCYLYSGWLKKVPAAEKVDPWEPYRYEKRPEFQEGGPEEPSVQRSDVIVP